MKLIDLVLARDALQKLIVQDLPIRKAYDLMGLADACNRHLAFYGQEIAKFDPEANPERLAKLDSLELDPIERVRISIDAGLRLSAADIKLLQPLIEFYEEE